MTLVVVMALTVIVGLLVLMDRQARRHDEERRAHRLEVVGLCQRVQAPETAVLQHAAEVAEGREGPLFTNEFDEDQRALEDVVGWITPSETLSDGDR